jgi:hypothetical protein
MRAEFENNKPPYVFRYRQNNENTLLEIINNNIYFPNNEKLNDPFDASYQMINFKKDNIELQKLYHLLQEKCSNPIARDYLRKTYENKPDDLYDLVSNAFRDFCCNFGIACFTITPLNIMLWANYANNHQGICIQYNTDLDKEFFKSIRPIDYIDKFQKIDYYPATEPEKYTELFYKKLEIWRSEYELRLIKAKHGFYTFNPLVIRSIAFGLRCPDEYKSQIIKIIKEKHNHIKLYETNILNDTYGLSFREILISRD